MVELDEENAAELTIDMTLALRLVWFTRPFLADFAMRGVAISFLGSAQESVKGCELTRLR
jgi:hypothetical protein